MNVCYRKANLISKEPQSKARPSPVLFMHLLSLALMPVTFKKCCQIYNLKKKNQSKYGVWSLDRISLDQITRSKVSNNFGTRSKVCFGTSSKVSIMFITRSKVFKV